jgi:YVTN family beta-propeller protein
MIAKAIAVNPLSNKVYVANFGSGTVSIIDGFTDKEEFDLRVGKEPIAIAATPYKIYVANSGSGTVSVINDTTGKKRARYTCWNGTYRYRYCSCLLTLTEWTYSKYVMLCMVAFRIWM